MHSSNQWQAHQSDRYGERSAPGLIVRTELRGAHVSDPGELMYPEQSAVHDFAAGDLAGLAQLGAGACEPAL
ncbi:hypothetical protein [Goekera deserti]|uniref:hypothetical protein n=1 Tax=Goekera deserti TaxID=2497753 RepID=UPI00187834B2|nr:hypothetical protein [Goekera deserti]